MCSALRVVGLSRWPNASTCTGLGLCPTQIPTHLSARGSASSIQIMWMSGRTVHVCVGTQAVHKRTNWSSHSHSHSPGTMDTESIAKGLKC